MGPFGDGVVGPSYHRDYEKSAIPQGLSRAILRTILALAATKRERRAVPADARTVEAAPRRTACMKRILIQTMRHATFSPVHFTAMSPSPFHAFLCNTRHSPARSPS
jgi:hypothetical protein